MKIGSIVYTPLHYFVLFFWIPVSSLYGADFTVAPLVNSHEVAVYEVSGNYDAELPDGSLNVSPRQEIIKHFYATHPDKYDFLLIFSNFDFQMPRDEAIAFYQEIRNDVQGIGKQLFDNSSLYGSNGVLQGTVDMGNIRSLISDPLEPGFSETMGTLSHELLHRWAADVTYMKPDDSIGSDLLGKDGNHWSFLLDTAGSLEYGNRWVDNGNGTFTSLTGRRYFSPLDMYLMGLIDKSEVAPMLLVDNPTIDPERLPEPGVTIEGTPQYITIDKIIAAEGGRIPDSADAQKSFKVGCIFITSPGTYLEKDLIGIRNIMGSWPMWFSGLTGGRASIAVESNPFLDLPENPGPSTPPIDPRTAPPEINDGLAWLLNSQMEDGSWQDSPFTAERDTTTVLQALAGYSPGESAIADGISWLEASNTVNLDYLSRKIVGLSGQQGRDLTGLTAELLARQNADGGWGSNRSYLSNPADTALALQALSKAGAVSPSVTDPAIDYLLMAQNWESGWGAEGHSNIQTSVDVVLAFIPFTEQRHLEIPIQKALAWIYGKQNSDGGFGNSPSTIYGTAKALLMMKQIGITSEVTDRAVSYLLGHQENNGSWQSSTYQTALAVQSIWIATREPDLSVSTEEIVPAPAFVTELPAEMRLAITVHNTGLTDVSDVKVALYEGVAESSGKIGEASVSLAGQGAETMVFTTSINDGSPHHYYVVVDPDNLIKESSEQNNTALRIIYPETTYDFAIIPGDIEFAPSVGSIFESLGISARIANKGTVDAFAVPLRIIADDGSGPITVASQSIDLPAGQSTLFSWSWIPEISGAGIPLSIILDTHDNFAEAAEDNNTATVAIDINGSTKPELAVSYSDISFAPSPALETGSVTIRAGVYNKGFSSAANVQVAFYDGVPGESGSNELGSVVLPVIGQGERVEAVLDWVNVNVSGERVISVVVDPQQMIDEISENNNSAFSVMQVLSLPDFEMLDSSISFSPESPYEGEPVAITASVYNNGQQPASNVPVGFYADGSLIGTSMMPEIAAGGQAAATITFDTQGRPGVTQIEVVVDPDETVPEQNRKNNRAVRSVGIQNGDLWLSHNYISPNGDGVKDWTEFGYRLPSQQDVTIIIVNEEDEVVREYSGPDYTSIQFVSLAWDGLDNKGRVVADGQYRIQVLSETGSVLTSLLVTVDTNRSSLLKAVGTPYLYQSEINEFLKDNKWIWFPDDSGILFHVETPNADLPDFPTGLYTMSPFGGDITRIVPWEWNTEFSQEQGYRFRINSSDCTPPARWLSEFFPGDQQNPGFSLAKDGLRIALILERYNKVSGQIDQSEIWTVNRFGDDLRLLASYDHAQGEQRIITDIFWSPNGQHIAFKSYEQISGQYQISIMRADGSEQVVITPDWTTENGNYYQLFWSPDSSHIAFAETTQLRVASLDGAVQTIMPVGNLGTFVDWFDKDRILVRDLTGGWIQKVWFIDLVSGNGPRLLVENLERPLGIYDAQQCIRTPDGKQEYNSPFMESGHVLVSIDWSDHPYEKFKICDGAGLCQDADILDYWWSNFALSPDSKYLVHSFYDGLLEVYDLETQQTEISVLGDYACGINWETDYLDKPSSMSILPLEGDCPNFSMDIVRWNWLDESTFLAWYHDGYYPDSEDGILAFDFKTKEKVSFPENWDLNNQLISPNRRYISFTSNWNRNQQKYHTVQINGSLLNLTADLISSKTESAIKLQGIAADLNFSNWKLEYADRNAPNDWHSITPPSDNPVVDGLFATWVPPYDGSFLVRLTVTDKAGNETWVRKIATWGKGFNVTNIYKTGEIFSPNSDGNLDTVGLNYTVHNPVHLDLFVHDLDGKLIRTFTQDHALAGEYGIVWDGKDETGGIVPDGYYAIRIFDYEFYVEVDTTPPDTQLTFSPFSCGEHPALQTSLSGLAVDKNLMSWTVQYGEGENPQEWTSFQSGETALATPKSNDEIDLALIKKFTTESSPSIGFLSNKTYRLEVEDFAGNQSVITARFNRELLVLYGWDGNPIKLENQDLSERCESPGMLPLSYLAAGAHDLNVAETLNTPIRFATVQYRKEMQWYDAEAVPDPPEGVIELIFDSSSLVPDEVTAVRVKLIDAAGLEYYSNSVAFNPPVFSAAMGCFPPGSMSPPLIRLAVSLPESLHNLKFQGTAYVNGSASWVNLAEYNVFDGYPYQFAAPLPGKLPAGYAYPLRFMGIGESGKVYVSNELTVPPRQCPTGAGSDLSGNESCKTNLNVTYRGEKATCNAVSSGSATIGVQYCPGDGPITLPDKVNYYLEENGASRLLKQFDPAVDGWGKVALATAGMQEGEHPVWVDLVYGESVVQRFRENTLIVDKTLPEADITYPSLSAPICARTQINEQGDILRYADIEGVATDAYDIQGYSIVYGQGTRPDQWFKVDDGIPCRPGDGSCSYNGYEKRVGKLGSWNVTNIEPMEYSLQLMVTDVFGNTSCFVTKAVVDMGMSLSATVDGTIFSPNSDGIKDEITIDYQVDEYAVVAVTVQQDDAIVRTLLADQVIANGSETIAWDGLGDGGITVSDGSYQILVVAMDSCGNVLQKKFAVTVDNTPPTTLILYPGTGEPLDIMTEVEGTATDMHLDYYQLLAHDEASIDEPILLNEGNIFIENDILGSWNTFGLEGNWALILKAVDLAGNARVTQLPVSFGTREKVISRLQADPKIFSPNNDGKLDSALVIYELTDVSNITIVLEDILGNSILTESFLNMSSGIHEYQWAGWNASGVIVPDGSYTFKVTAESISPPYVVQVETITLITDTGAPAIVVTMPADSSYSQGEVAVQGALSDPNLNGYSVTLSGMQQTDIIKTATINNEIVFSNTLDLPEGFYSLQVDAEDAAENVSSRRISFTVDTSRPGIELVSPADGEFFGGANSVISIRGIIEETNPRSYSVQYGSGHDPAQWFDIASGEGLPSANLIATWSVGPNQGIEDGDYTIRVIAIDQAGWQSVAQTRIHVDNNAPELAFIFPGEGDFVTRQFDIRGTVSDAFLKEYTLALADAACSTEKTWSVISKGNQPVANDRMYSFVALPPDGVYCIRLSAVDSLGNISETGMNFAVDTTPPASPVLVGGLEGGAASLTWQDNSEPDLAGFNLYRNNVKINANLLTGTEFLDQQLEAGEYVYTVRAVDQAGWESTDSNQLVFTVDFTPPEAMISSPGDGFLVGNYVDISGRAYSKDDFREYRVSYGMGEDPQTWHLLRNSPVPVSYGELVRWDVLSLEAGLYTIRLEAEDVSGNINEQRVTVTVDNTPPAPPVLLTATQEGAAVDLVWQANAEPDVAGYLVFRNGQLANVSGTVVGDLTPYLVAGISYQDVDVPDGIQEYFLVAMDNAGNMSDQSNSLQVSIDTHAPHLHIVSPSAGLAFDKPIPLKADTEDTDIAMVRFQYQHSGDAIWTDLGPVLTRSPYVVTLDPLALGWEYGPFRIRAVATDLGALSDVTPEEVLIQYRDVTPPASPTGMHAKVNGGTVILTWNRNLDTDLAGYNVYLGGSPYRRNAALLADPPFTDPSLFGDGAYAFTITAVDTAGNESEKAPVNATVFTTVLNQSQGIVGSPDIVVDGSTVPGAAVEIFRNGISGVESLGTVQAEADGLFTLAVTLTEGNNSLFAVATDEAENISRPSNTIMVVYGTPPAAPTGLAALAAENDVALSWNPNTEPDLAGYNVYRATGEDWQMITAVPVPSPGYADPGLKNGSYVYRVTAVNNSGIESRPSNESQAVIESQPPVPPSNLSAAAAPEGGAIDLCWEASTDPVAGYLVYRSMASGGPYTQLSGSVTMDLCYHDSGLMDGKEYFYVVRAMDSLGNESIDSNEASAFSEDTVAPDKPLLLLPTISGRPFQSQVEQVDITGLAEAGSRVELFHDQDWVDSAEALRAQVHQSFYLTDFYVSETVAVPDGKQVYYSIRQNASYPYEYYTYRKDLETGVESRIDQIPEGSWEYEMSPDGTRIAYNYDDAGWGRIGIYDIATGTATPLTADVDVDEWDPSWSGDGTKVAFEADRGDGLYDIWVHDLVSGVTSRVTQDFEGFYPKISSDGQLVDFHTWSSVNRRLNLYLIESAGGTPVLVADDVDWSAYYPSVDWSPQENKLAYTANRDGAYDIYVLDTDTGETSRLTETDSIEMELQWSPDGKYIAYHAYSGGRTEVRMVPAAGAEQESLLHSFEGSIDIDFNWLPSGIFYRVGPDLHKIIPPGTFTFEDVGLHAGQNMFSATAEDEAGNVSQQADEILVRIDAEAMPDLEVRDQDISVLPSAPIAGEGTTLNAQIRNISRVTAENVSVEIYLWDSGDNIELIHSEVIPFLDANSSEWVSVNWDSTGMTGTNTIFVLLDSYNGIAESREDNNFASSSFYVAGEEGVTFGTFLNGTEFRSDEIVSIDVVLHNSGPAKEVRLTVTVEDENGGLVEELPVQDLTLYYGANEDVTLNWQADSVYAGPYQVRVVLSDSDSGLIGEQVKSFIVHPDVSVGASLTTDKAEYGPDESVLFKLSVANLGVNAILPELKVHLTVSDDAQILYETVQTLSSLFPLDSATINASWNTSRNAAGTYTGSVVILNGNAVVAESLTEFTIVPVMEIAGSISADPKVIFQGGGVEARFSMTNSGNVAAGEVMLKLLVLDTKNWTTIGSHAQTISLGMEETVSGQYPFAGLDLDPGVYQVLLQSHDQGVIRNLASDTFTVRDGTAPVVSIVSPLDGSVLNDAVELSVTSTDGGSGVAVVEYRVDNGSWLPLPLVNQATGRYASKWLPVEADEGTHTIQFRAGDHAGNLSLPVSCAIVVQPRIDMTTATDKDSYSMHEDVAVSIDLVNIAWQKQVHLTTQIEAQDGTVLAEIVSEDLVLGSGARQSLGYTWNTGIVAAGKYVARSTIRKNGSVLAESFVAFAIEKVVAVTGTLVLSDTSNSPGESVRGDWTVVNNGNVDLAGLSIENLLTAQFQAELRVWTESADLARGQTLSGSFLLDTQDMAIGDYLITLKARYEAKRFELAGARFELVDTIPPVVGILSPAEGAVVDGPIEIAVSATDDAAGVEGVEFSIDQAGWQPMSLADPGGNVYTVLWTPVETDEGVRAISIRGRDRAGNISQPASVGVTVELCSPFDNLAGILQLMTPVPLYYSQDIVLEHTITNQCNKELSGLNSRFVVRDPATGDIVYETVATSSLAPGKTSTGRLVVSSLELAEQEYTVQLEVYQTDKGSRVLAESAFEIKPAIEVEKKPLEQTNILVWLNKDGESCGASGYSYHHDYWNDERDDRESYEHDDGESYSQVTCEQRCAAYPRLENILSQTTDNFMITCSRNVFGQELRNPIYTDILIIGDDSQLSEQYGKELQELRERVYAGTGLISFGWNVAGNLYYEGDDDHHEYSRNDDDHFALGESFLGVATKGMLDSVEPTITFDGNFVTEGGELKIAGRLIHAEAAEGTEVVGWALDDCSAGDPWQYGDDGHYSYTRDDDHWPGCETRDCTYPVFVLNEYGQGKTTYAAFDLCGAFTELNDDRLSELLFRSVSFVHRFDDEERLIPYHMKPFSLAVTSPGLDFNLQLDGTCPAEINIFDPLLNAWIKEYPWQMTLPVQAGETVDLPYYALEPDQEGIFTCELDTGYVADNQYILLQKFVYDFAVQTDSRSLLEEAIGIISGLQVTWYELYKRDSALQYLQYVLARTVTSREDTERNIRDIIGAIDALREIESIDVQDIRLKLDTLLRIEQSRNYLFE